MTITLQAEWERESEHRILRARGWPIGYVYPAKDHLENWCWLVELGGSGTAPTESEARAAVERELGVVKP